MTIAVLEGREDSAIFDFRCWHETEMVPQSPHVCCCGKNGPSRVRPLPASLAGGAGARPDHPTNGHRTITALGLPQSKREELVRPQDIHRLNGLTSAYSAATAAESSQISRSASFSLFRWFSIMLQASSASVKALKGEPVILTAPLLRWSGRREAR
jgi:hypothetical protein